MHRCERCNGVPSFNHHITLCIYTPYIVDENSPGGHIQANKISQRRVFPGKSGKSRIWDMCIWFWHTL